MSKKKILRTIPSFGGMVRKEGEEESRSRTFVISSKKRDRHGTVLPVDMWKLDNYRGNNGVYWMHQTDGGWWEEKEINPDWHIGTGEVEIVEERLLGTTTFESQETHLNVLAEKIFRKIKHGALPATSVGFDPYGGGHWGVEENGEDTGTYYFHEMDLLEYSHVFIPSNPEALMLRDFGGMRTFLENETGPVGPEVIAEKEAKLKESMHLDGSRQRAYSHLFSI